MNSAAPTDMVLKDSVLTSTAGLSSPIGLVAGSGRYPVEFAQGAKSKGFDVITIAHLGESDPELEKYSKQCVWIKVGELGKIISVLKTGGARQVAFAGGISRVKLFGGVKLDLRAMALIARKRSVKDDVILRGIGEELERDGISVISASVLLPESIPSAGYLTKRKFSAEEIEDAMIGWEAAKGLGALDIGQTAVVSKGLVVALECVAGTDKAVIRGGELSGGNCVVVKLAKPQQDLRLDLPAIGVQTIESMRKAGAKALLIESGKCLLLEREELLRAANDNGISVLAVSSAENLSEYKNYNG